MRISYCTWGMKEIGTEQVLIEEMVAGAVAEVLRYAVEGRGLTTVQVDHMEPVLNRLHLQRPGHLGHVDLVVRRVGEDDLAARLPVGWRYKNHPVKSPWTSKGRIEVPGCVGRRQALGQRSRRHQTQVSRPSSP